MIQLTVDIEYKCQTCLLNIHAHVHEYMTTIIATHWLPEAAVDAGEFNAGPLDRTRTPFGCVV